MALIFAYGVFVFFPNEKKSSKLESKCILFFFTLFFSFLSHSYCVSYCVSFVDSFFFNSSQHTIASTYLESRVAEQFKIKREPKFFLKRLS